MDNFSEMFFKDVLEYNYTSLTFEDDIGKIMDEEFFIFPLGNNYNTVTDIGISCMIEECVQTLSFCLII